jgi:sugar lactone lactonase YvrE
MRRSRLFLLAIALLVAATLTFLYLKPRRLPPTQFDWKAQVINLAGDGSPLGLSDPFGVAISGDGTIYIADAGENNRISKLTTTGGLVSLAGSREGYADGRPGAFNSPSGLAIDSDGNLYVADTGNNRIRKITPQGMVSTIAGSGVAGYADGPATSAQFDGPIGVAVDANGNLYVADTYNDRIRKVSTSGQVTTIAGAGLPGYTDGEGGNALFDTPCAVVVSADGTLFVADTGNNQIRKITAAGQVTTFVISFVAETNRTWLRSPVGLALTHDGFLYVTELDRGTVVQAAPDGKACVIAGLGSGYASGSAELAQFNQPAGLAVDPRNGDLVVADGANYLVRRLAHEPLETKGRGEGETGGRGEGATTEVLPRLTPETLGIEHLIWPLAPQDQPHEVVATMGEVRGSFDSTDSRDHLHSGLDVVGTYGEVVHAIRSEKVTSPLPDWGFNSLSEGLRVGVVSYVHVQVGRDLDSRVFNDPRFVSVKTDDGKLARIRVRRGTRFQPGDALGTINKMYHVHLIVGPPGAEVNPLSLSPVGFRDKIAPLIEKDGIQLFDEQGKRFTEQQQGRLVVYGRVQIVVDAYDRTDLNFERRRLGLYRLGYQVFKAGVASDANVTPAPGFNEPRTTIVFNRLPSRSDAPKLAYASDSGITVYGSKITRFLYQVTNTIRDGRVEPGVWDTSGLPKGDYVLRIIGADYSSNETRADVPLTIK